MPYKSTIFTCEYCGILTHARARSPRFCSPTCRNKASAGNGRPLADRFWEKVDYTSNPDGCWLWLAGRNDGGYGTIRDTEGGEQLAHRVAYVLAYGFIPAGMKVLHSCDNPPCVRASHLWLGTNVDNNTDRHGKGRTAVGPKASNHLTQLDPSAVRKIRLALSRGESQYAVAVRFNVSRSAIKHIATGRTWRHVD